MREFRAIAEYIAENYPSARRIVEVGVGRLPEAAVELSKLLPACEIVATDIAEPPGLPSNIKFVRDDVTDPDLSIYEGAALVYSMRPPPELQPYLLRLAREVGADLLLRPLAGESVLAGGKPVNYRGATFYIFGSRAV